MSADIDKKIASIVRKEIKNENYDDSCWLKAFKKAGGDENKAKVFYIDFRTNDLRKIAEKEKKAEDLKTNTYVQCGRSFCSNKYQIISIPKKSLGTQICDGCGNTLDQTVNEKSALRDIEQKQKPSGTTKSSIKKQYIKQTNLSIKPSGNYFFNGTKSLAVTFWVYLIGGNFAFKTLTILLDSNKADTEVVMFVIILNVIWNILAIMGVFNSANIYKAEKIQKGLNYPLATTAKVVTVILVIAAIGNSIPK